MSLLALEGSWRSALPRPQRGAAFDWWYVDARDAGGSGLVVIWANRLPFFDTDEPSLNVALYRNGRPAFWLLQHHPRSAWNAGLAEVRLGRSRLLIGRTGPEVRLQMELDLDLPSERRPLTGLVQARGLLATLPPAPAGHPHRWMPFLPAAWVQADLLLGHEPLFTFDGPGYADRNLGDARLGELGVDRWWWGRATRGGDESIIFYLVEGPAGRQLTLLRASPRGVRSSSDESITMSPGRIRLGAVEAELGEAVERGPFYTRSFGTLREGGWEAPLIAETCEVGRIGALAPLVRMRAHRPGGENSLFAPLFVGTREGRLRRLLGRLAGAT